MLQRLFFGKQGSRVENRSHNLFSIINAWLQLCTKYRKNIFTSSLHARDVECSYCDFVSFQSEKLEAHISRHHKSEPRRDDADKFLFCKFCKQKLQNKTELKEHCFKTHKFCCDCDLNFKNQVDLQQHIRHGVQVNNLLLLYQ